MKKPIVGFIAGVTAPRVHGHAARWISGGVDTADAKLVIMEACGFTVTRNPSEMGVVEGQGCKRSSSLMRRPWFTPGAVSFCLASLPGPGGRSRRGASMSRLILASHRIPPQAGNLPIWRI